MPQWCVRSLSGPRLAQARLQVDEAERHVGQEPAPAVQGVGVGFSGYFGDYGSKGFKVYVMVRVGACPSFFREQGEVPHDSWETPVVGISG